MNALSEVYRSLEWKHLKIKLALIRALSLSHDIVGNKSSQTPRGQLCMFRFAYGLRAYVVVHWITLSTSVVAFCLRLLYYWYRYWSVAWRSVNALCRINEVTLRRARLVLGWVSVYGQVNHHGTKPASYVNSACYPPWDDKMNFRSPAE